MSLYRAHRKLRCRARRRPARVTLTACVYSGRVFTLSFTLLDTSPGACLLLDACLLGVTLPGTSCCSAYHPHAHGHTHIHTRTYTCCLAYHPHRHGHTHTHTHTHTGREGPGTQSQVAPCPRPGTQRLFPVDGLDCGCHAIVKKTGCTGAHAHVQLLCSVACPGARGQGFFFKKSIRKKHMFFAIYFRAFVLAKSFSYFFFILLFFCHAYRCC